MKEIHTVYEVRSIGRKFCQTEGSEHYKTTEGIEPAEYAIANGEFVDFALTNIHKYTTRYKQTRNLEDLKKVSDYAQLLCGAELIRTLRHYETQEQKEAKQECLANMKS